MSERREKVMQAAEKLVARGKLSQAIREYRKLLQDNPDDTNTLNRVGDLYARQDKVDEAIELFEQIAASYSRDGFFVKAIAIYKKIIRLDPTQISVYEHLAELYHRQGLLSEARSQYQVLADYYLKHEDMPATIEVHRKMADLEPSNPSPRVKLAELYLAEGLVEETIGEYQRIAEVMLEHGRVDQATKVYLRALDIDSSDLAFVSEAVLALREGGFQAEAEEVFETAVRLNPDAAELADRMRQHEEGPTAEPGTETTTSAAEVVEPPPVDADSIDVSELLTEESSQTPPTAGGDDVAGVEMTDDGAFVIDLDEEETPLEAAAEEPVRGEEVEIDLAELEEAIEPETPPGGPPQTPAEERPATKPPDDPVASIDALARSLGVGKGREERDRPQPSPTAPIEAGPRPIEIDELLAEAEVFAKYGLQSKAVRRLEQAVEIEPAHLEAHRRLVLLALERGAEERVLEVAQRMLDSVDEVGGGAAWESVLGALVEAGYRIDDGRIEAVVGEAPSEPVEEPAEETVAAEEEEGLEWLEAKPAGESAPTTDDLFEAEEEFFDLAAELEKELGTEEEADEVTDVAPSADESLEEIVQGFKKGVAEVLSPEAYDTHYNLGIAYREMGLIDEAIGEFQLSAKDPDHLVDSCSMLGASFLDKGFPDLAVKWYRRGLEAPNLTEDETLSLLYDLGSVYAESGEREAAYETFVEIYGINSHYRDVVARLEELRGG